MNIGIITGSGFYDFPELEGFKKITVKTAFGEAELSEAVFGSHNIYFIARHGDQPGCIQKSDKGYA